MQTLQPVTDEHAAAAIRRKPLTSTAGAVSLVHSDQFGDSYASLMWFNRADL
jgi:hypothetical protein